MVYLINVSISGKENLKICHLIFDKEREKRVSLYVRVQWKHQDCTFVDQWNKVNIQERKHYPDRPYTCEHCGDKDSFSYITEIHYSRCHQYPVYCPNDCKREKIPRYQLEDHLDTSCSLQIVECEFSWAGCKVKRRWELPRHCSENLQKQFSFIAKACKKLKRENWLLKKENAKIKKYVVNILINMLVVM